jgi:hypothetical protein
MLVVLTVLMLRDCETACFIDVEEVTFEFSECGERFVKEIGAPNIGVETLVGSSIERVIAAAADGAFDEVGVRVGDAGVVAIARENANAVEV